MAARGEFVGADGHRYSVAFSGASVTDRELLLQGVSISMAAHERKFVGFKSTACQVQVVTDEPLIDLYAAHVRDIAVRVVDETSGEAVFCGYVVPFSFDQAFTGCADVVTIDCVDAVTAIKDKPYLASSSVDYGCDVPADTVMRVVMSMAGDGMINRIIYHQNFDSQSGATSYPFKAMVAQAGFLQDEMTALDALNAVCLFFGYTCSMVGDMLCFYDEHCMTKADEGKARNAWVGTVTASGHKYTRKNGDASPMKVVDLAERVLHNDMSVSIERAYDAVQINLKGSDTAVLCPDVCADENIATNTDGRGTEPVFIEEDIADTQNDIKLGEERLAIGSKVMSLGRLSGENRVAWDDPKYLKGYFENGAQLIRAGKKESLKLYYYDIDKSDTTRVTLRGDKKNYLWVRNKDGNAIGAAAEQVSYLSSHTGGIVELRYKGYIAGEDNKRVEELDTELEPLIRNQWLGAIQLRFGDVYYESDYSDDNECAYRDTMRAQWSSKDMKTIRATATANKCNAHDKVLVPVPNDGQVAVIVGWPGIGLVPPYNSYGLMITQLELVGYGDEMWSEHPELRHEWVSEPEHVLDVETTLTTRKSVVDAETMDVKDYVGVNARPSVVAGEVFPCGGYMGRSDSEVMPATGVLMEQLKERYGVPHLRYQVTMEGVINPYDTVVLNGAKYTIEGYERDLVNNRMNIIIN